MSEVNSAVQLSCLDFSNALASKAPTPGGGGAAALSGALGAALGHMVIQLTLGKKRYAAHDQLHRELQEQLEALQSDMLAMIDRDAESFRPLAAAYGIKAETNEEKEAKEVIMQAALKNAVVVPLEITQAAFRGLEIQAKLAQTGSRLAISDVACGVQALRTALLSGRVNVLINLSMISDQEYVAENKSKLDTLCNEGVALADSIFATVEAALWSEA